MGIGKNFIFYLLFKKNTINVRLLVILNVWLVVLLSNLHVYVYFTEAFVVSTTIKGNRVHCITIYNILLNIYLYKFWKLSVVLVIPFSSAMRWCWYWGKVVLGDIIDGSIKTEEVEIMLSALVTSCWWWVNRWWSRCWPGCHQVPQQALGLQMEEVTASSGVGLNLGCLGSWWPCNSDLRMEDWKDWDIFTWYQISTTKLN